MRPAAFSEPRHPADDEPTIETSVPTAQFLAQLAGQEELLTPASSPELERPPPTPDSDKTISASTDMIDALTSNARRTDPPPVEGDAVTTALPPLLGPLEQPPPSFGPPIFPLAPFRPPSNPIPFVPLVSPSRGNNPGARILGGLVAVAYALLMMKLLWLASEWLFHH